MSLYLKTDHVHIVQLAMASTVEARTAEEAKSLSSLSRVTGGDLQMLASRILQLTEISTSFNV